MAGSNLVQSLIKGLDILLLAADSDTGIRLSDICERHGLKASTAHNLVRTLTARGFLAKVDGNRYVPGAVIDELARRKNESLFMRKAADAVRFLGRQFPQATVTFGNLQGTDIIVSLRMSPDQPGILQQSSERTFNLYANASGLVFQAFGSEVQLTALRQRHPFHEYGSHLWDTEERLRDYLAQVRMQGYAQRPFAEREIFRIAAPVWEGGRGKGRLIGTLGVSIPEGASPTEFVVEMVLKAAAELGSAG